MKLMLRRPEEFIGSAGQVARVLFAKARRFNENPDAWNCDPLDRCWLFTGAPGLGKSSLAQALALQIAGSPFAIDQVNGQSWSVDVVRRWRDSSAYLPLYGNNWARQIDEIDAASPAAANEARSYLDNLPPHNVIIATTNVPARQLQPQLASRFKVYNFTPVPTAEIVSWLMQTLEITAELAHQAADSAAGNVREAKANALSILEALEVA